MFKALGLLYHSTLGLKVTKIKKKTPGGTYNRGGVNLLDKKKDAKSFIDGGRVSWCALISPCWPPRVRAADTGPREALFPMSEVRLYSNTDASCSPN